MRRGKVIGALVLVAAIGLLVYQQFGGSRREPVAEAPTAAGGAVLAQPGSSLNPGAEALSEAPGVAQSYAVDGSRSEVYWRIYRAGALARLGHNHVISVGQLSGNVSLGSDPQSAEWTLRIPVAALVVDDPAIRARHGDDFASVPSDGDKEGTKRNMLSPDVLNGETYPEVRLQGRGVFGPLDAAELPVTIEILGRTVERRFPARIEIGADSLTVTGEYRLSHADLGMTPFTALGGAMAVGDAIDFSYRIHAVAVGR